MREYFYGGGFRTLLYDVHRATEGEANAAISCVKVFIPFLNQNIASTIETSSLISLGDSEQSFFNLKSVLLSNGYFKLNVDNDLPFQITNLSLVVMSGSETIWEVNAVDVDPYTLYNSQKDFSNSPITISMTEDISYTFNIAISPEQAGNPLDANWNESCFPNIDNPPIYHFLFPSFCSAKLRTVAARKPFSYRIGGCHPPFEPI